RCVHRSGQRGARVRRREFITLLGGATAWPLAARAQQSGRVWRIGMLETTSMALNAANLEAFRQSLRELGYIEEQNLIIEYRSAEGLGERFTDLAADLLRLNMDVIVTRGTPAALAAKKATTTTPIVMAATGDPLMAVGRDLTTCRRAHCQRRRSHSEKSKLDHAIGGGSWAARNLRLEGVHRRRRADRVWAALPRPLSSRRRLRRQNSSRRQSLQSSGRATDEIRADHQPQGHKGHRAPGADDIDGSRRRGDRVI